MSGRVCCVLGCSNSSRKIQVWNKTTCEIHPPFLHRDCPCVRPYTLHRFPGRAEEKAVRQKWIININRKDFVPTKNSTVCGIHFPDGRPTKEHPFPVLHMGYEYHGKTSPGRRGRPTKKCRRDLKVNTSHAEPDVMESHVKTSGISEWDPHTAAGMNLGLPPSADSNGTPQVPLRLIVKEEDIKEEEYDRIVDEDIKVEDMREEDVREANIKVEDIKEEEYEHMITCQDDEEKPLTELLCKTAPDFTESLSSMETPQTKVEVKVEKEEDEGEPQDHDSPQENVAVMEGTQDSTSLEGTGGGPWPHLAPLFTPKCKKGNNYIMKCTLCLPKNNTISAFHNSSSNLRKHIERRHPGKLRMYKECMAKPLRYRRSSDTNSSCLTVQTKLMGRLCAVPQVKVDQLITDFVCDGLLPLSLVELPAFKKLVVTLSPTNSVMTRTTLCARIDTAAEDMNMSLKKEFSAVKYVATTTDCWTAWRRSFIGVTCHWIDENTLQRHSAALACRPVKGSHSLEVLAAALEDIHLEYHIQDKVVKTTTDNGSNFLKAFRGFGNHTAVNPELEQDLNDDEDECTPDGEHDDVEFQNTTEILSQNDNTREYQLPPHQKCACHLLNLVATSDVLEGAGNETFKRLYFSSFSKCNAVWNEVGRAHQATESVENECRLQLICPSKTGWNSTFMAVERIARIIKQNGEDAMRNICSEFKVKMFNAAEISFLEEYSRVMKPVAAALDILQAETNSYMGWLLPTVYHLEGKLLKMETSVEVCLPLLKVLQKGLRKQFQDMKENPDLIAAAILLPKFKNNWTDKKNVIKLGTDYIRRHIELVEITQDTSSIEQDDFFSAMKTKKSDELDDYLACSSEKMDLLHAFPALKKLSIKLNTPLPASVACERLLSCEWLNSISRRARLGDKNFENQLLLKLNRKKQNGRN
ncbi:uncharacterized protein LOC125297258 isoform X1 [Alosa alosa]|uniref:uncharacterized protein LOC125297258 isoform X1 n=1 Tax=Alosa alosa TaxID=278164 RepID=UPI0020150FD3|nr:uncharacterized protein LOC125297258 isoform X1 [Alosa alosa]